MSNLTRWEKVVGLCAAALVVTLWAPWYSLQEQGVDTSSGSFREENPGLSAWEAFGFIDILLLAAGVAVAGLIWAKATSRRVNLPVAPGAVFAVLGILTFALVALRVAEIPTGPIPEEALDAAGLEFTPFFAWIALILTGLIAYGGFKLMRIEGTGLAEQVERVRNGSPAVTAGPPPAAEPVRPPAPAPPPSPARRPRTGAPDREILVRRRRMSLIMFGCGAAVALGSFLSWADGPLNSVNGIDAWQGKLTLAAGVGLCMYAYQGFNPKSARVQHHGWAIAAIVVLFFIGGAVSNGVEDLNDGAAGGSVEVGNGMFLIWIATLVAIWPLVVLRREDRHESEGSAGSTSRMAPVQPAAVADHVSATAPEPATRPRAVSARSRAPAIQAPPPAPASKLAEGDESTVVDEPPGAPPPRPESRLSFPSQPPATAANGAPPSSPPPSPGSRLPLDARPPLSSRLRERLSGVELGGRQVPPTAIVVGVLVVAVGAFAVAQMGGGGSGTSSDDAKLESAPGPGDGSESGSGAAPGAARTPAPSRPADSPEAPTESEVQNLLDTYEQRYAAEDADGLGELFADDGLRVSEGVTESRAEAIATYREQFSNLSDPNYSLSETQIDARPGGATVTGRYSISSSQGTVGGSIRFSLVERDGHLVIERLEITPD